MNNLGPAKFEKGSQYGWYHREPNVSGGFFHTYDNFLPGKDKPRKIHVFLPNDYETSGEYFPVLYFNDGNTTFWPGGLAGKSWRVGETLSKLWDNQAVRKVIVVAVHPIDRFYEYTHQYWAPSYNYGGLDEYSKYLATTIKGFIDKNYRTLSSAEETAIIGSSHGGLAAFYIANACPEQFGKCVAMSPSFWIGLDTNGGFKPIENSKLIEVLGETLKDKKKRPIIWMDWGLKRDGGAHNFLIELLATKKSKEMLQLLTTSYDYKLNKDIFVFEDSIGGHDEDAWAYRFELVMKAFYGKKETAPVVPFSPMKV